MLNRTADMIDLGDRVKDPITGFTGIVTCITYWLHGCVRVGVQPEVLHEGKPVEDRYFDEAQMRIVSKRVHQPTSAYQDALSDPAQLAGVRPPGGPAREGPGFRR